MSISLLKTSKEVIDVSVAIGMFTMYILPLLWVFKGNNNNIFEYFKAINIQIFIYFIYFITYIIYFGIDIQRINTVWISILCFHFSCYLFCVLNTKFPKKSTIKFNLIHVKELNIDFIQPEDDYFFSVILIDLSIVTIEKLEIKKNAVKVKSNELLKILGNYNIYMCKNLLKYIKEKEFLENSDANILRNKKIIQEKLYVHSLKTYVKKYWISVNNIFPEFQQFGEFKLRHPFYIIAIMALTGFFIFNEDNMTITDNYIASNIAMKNYENFCKIKNPEKLEKCYELEKVKEEPFEIPKFYGEYNNIIYTFGLFLPLENNQTKSFKPSKKYVEYAEFLYRLAGYFLWIMIFAKIKTYLGDNGEIKTSKD